MAIFYCTMQQAMNFPRLQYRMSVGSVPPILILGCRWSWVVCFTSRVLYPRWESKFDVFQVEFWSS